MSIECDSGPVCSGRTNLQGTIWHIIHIGKLILIAKSIQSTNPGGSVNVQMRLVPQIDPRTELLITHASIVFSDIIGGSYQGKTIKGPIGTVRDNQQLDLSRYFTNSIIGIDSILTIRNSFLFRKCKSIDIFNVERDCCCIMEHNKRKSLAITHGSYQYASLPQNDTERIIFNCDNITTADLAAILNKNYNAGIPPESRIVQANI